MMLDLEIFPAASDIYDPTIALCKAIEIVHRLKTHAYAVDDETTMTYAVLLDSHLRAARTFAS